MRLIWPENVNFRRKMAVFGGSGGFWRERRFLAGATVSLPFFSVLQVDTFNSENLKKNRSLSSKLRYGAPKFFTFKTSNPSPPLNKINPILKLKAKRIIFFYWLIFKTYFVMFMLFMKLENIHNLHRIVGMSWSLRRDNTLLNNLSLGVILVQMLYINLINNKNDSEWLYWKTMVLFRVVLLEHK